MTMTKNRTILFLAAALALLGLVALLARRSEDIHQASTSARGRLLPKLEAARLVKLEVRSGDKTALLEQRQGSWKLMPEGYAADAEAVTDALGLLEKLEKSSLVSTRADKHGTFEVEQGGKSTEVKVWTAEGPEPAAHLFLGKSGPDFSSNYVRLAGQDEVFLSNRMIRSSFDRTRGWRDRTIFRFPAGEATRVEIAGDTRIVLEKSGEGESAGWALVEPEAGPARASAVDAMLRTLSDLEADEFATETDPGKTGLAAPKASIKVSLADGRSFELAFGNDSPAGRAYTRRGDGDTVYELSSYRRTSILQKLPDLREPPAETQPAAPAPAPARP